MVNPRMTKSEEHLMELFWESETPLTSVQILEITKDESWNGNYVHVMLRALEKKGLIQVCGMQQYGNQYARVFEPALTKAEYAAEFVTYKGLANSLSEVTVALARKKGAKDNTEIIDQLQNMIDELKKG